MARARRVVVTGMGTVSPIGNGVAAAWSSLVAGRSGIGPIPRFVDTDFQVRFGGTVRDFDPAQHVPAKDVKKMDPFIHYAIAAAHEAMQASGLEIDEALQGRAGVAIGAGIGGIGGIEKTTEAFLAGGPRKISPFYIPSTIVNMASGHVAIRYGMKGPNIAVVTACTTGTHNLGLAARLIAYGDADVMLAGGAEHATTPTAIGGFTNSKALSTFDGDPTRASRPFDARRDGFVLSDGAGVMLLEEYEFARRRGAPILAELSGFGMSDDAFHMTAPPDDGSGAAAAMQNALRDAGLNPEDIDYLNAHATSTPLGDVAEVRAIKRCFGEHARTMKISATKSMTGHLLGAAGGVEAIYSVLALRHGVLPPTINLEEPDPECDLDFVPNVAREATLRHVMSNSFGFGGTNGTLIFSRV